MAALSAAMPHSSSSAGNNGMLILPRTFLACRILHYLATCPGGVAKQVDIARAVSAPKPYTGKVARELLFAGFVKSVRGYHGGYALAVPPSSIRLGDVAELIEEKRAWKSHLHTNTGYMGSVLSDARRAFLNVLNERSMADLSPDIHDALDEPTDAHQPARRRKRSGHPLKRSDNKRGLRI